MHLAGLIAALAVGGAGALPSFPAPSSKTGAGSIAAREAEDRKVVCRYIASAHARFDAKGCRAGHAWNLLGPGARPAAVDVSLRPLQPAR